jgi:hypothetical protein
MLILEKQYPPMRKLTKPWKLCRSFGIRTVGNVAGPRWPEAGITAREIPSQTSRWAFRGKVDTHCRPADLPTCRPADLPTCRPADLPTCRPADLPTCPIWVLDFSDSSEVSPAFNSKAGNFTASFSTRPRLPSQGPAMVRTSSSVFRARCNLPQLSFSRWKQRATTFERVQAFSLMSPLCVFH